MGCLVNRKARLVDLCDPIGTAVELVRLVRRDLDCLFELAGCVRRARGPHDHMIGERVDGRLAWRDAASEPAERNVVRLCGLVSSVCGAMGCAYS